MTFEVLQSVASWIEWPGWLAVAALCASAGLRLIWTVRAAVGHQLRSFHRAHWALFAAGALLGAWVIVDGRASWLDAYHYPGCRDGFPMHPPDDAGMLLGLGVGLCLRALIGLVGAAARLPAVTASDLAGWSFVLLLGVAMLRLGWGLVPVIGRVVASDDRPFVIDEIYRVWVPALRMVVVGLTCGAIALVSVARPAAPPVRSVRFTVALLVFGGGAYLTTRGMAHDALLRGPIVENHGWARETAPTAAACGGYPLNVELHFFEGGELILDGIAHRQTETAATALEAIQRKHLDLHAMLGDAWRGLEINVDAAAHEPTASIIPWIRMARDEVGVRTIHVVGLRVTVLRTRTRGTVRHRQACAHPVRLFEGGTPASSFATWDDVYRSAETGPLALDLDR